MAASQTKTPTLPDNAANHELEAAAPEAETTIEAGDDTASNADTGYGTEDDSYASTSLHSSVKNYNFEHGRRYHKYAEESAYILPNDEAEQDREEYVLYVPINSPAPSSCECIFCVVAIRYL